jgi:hypothetical protein
MGGGEGGGAGSHSRPQATRAGGQRINKTESSCSGECFYISAHDCRYTFEPQSTYIPRVPQCLSPRPISDPSPPTPASECVPPEPKGEWTHSPAGEGVGSPNSDYWRKSLLLCLLPLCFEPFFQGRVDIVMEESFLSILSPVNGVFCLLCLYHIKRIMSRDECLKAYKTYPLLFI